MPQIDLENAPTVEEFVRTKNCNKFWLCPSAVSSGKISRPFYLGGCECTTGTVPDEIKQKKVRKSFGDNDTFCIIWENDEDEILPNSNF